MLVNLVDLAAQIRLDADRGEHTRHRRYREIGQALGHLRTTRRAQAIEWLKHLRNADEPSPRRQALYFLHLVTWVMVIAGLLIGGIAAYGVFYYDGTHQVNTVFVLGVFVGLQLLLVLFGVSVLSRRMLQFLPGFNLVQDTLRHLSPGRLQPLITRWLPQGKQENLELCDWKRIHSRKNLWAGAQMGHYPSVLDFRGVVQYRCTCRMFAHDRL